MRLDFLETVDRSTANNILAAAALSTAPQAGVDNEEIAFIDQYETQVAQLLSEIRQKLNIKSDDTSPPKALESYVVSGDAAAKALHRAAQQGRLSPAAYEVVQPRFYPLAITKAQIDEVVHHPDDYQHLLTEGALEDEADIFSLFMKRAGGRNHGPNWLLVQCVRNGARQVAQSAWRIYPKDIDLTSAEAPLDVLRLFVDKFGITVKVGEFRGKFVETISMLKSKDTELMQYGVEIVTQPNADVFLSSSNRRTSDPNLFKVGLIYCIDMTLYRSYLIAHGAAVRPR